MTNQPLEIRTTAQTIFGEARGEGEVGMTAVADVIANRVAVARLHVEEHGTPHPLFGDGTFGDCCRRPWQFSCWNANDPNLPKLHNVSINDPVFLSAMSIATAAVHGTLIDETKGATYYYAKSAPEAPDWADGLEPCVEIGHQLFFNNVQ